MHVSHTRHLIAPVASVITAWIEWRTRAVDRVALAWVGGVEVVGEWARVDVPKTRAVVDLASVVKLIECGDEPRPGPIVAVVIMVACGGFKGSIALSALATARDTASVLDGEHAYAWLDAVAKRPACAIDFVVVDELVEYQAVVPIAYASRGKGSV